MTQTLSAYRILGESQAMQTLAAWVHTAAPHVDPILLTGERGTGKELLAHAIHTLGPAKGTMVILDCSTLPLSTLESVLFGHERGSFTGATHRHIGLLENAQGGSLFIDELHTLPLSVQHRFLRFIEEGHILRIGGTLPLTIHCRIIAASNRDLAAAVAGGRFLPDLYDRLNVLHATIPPLRERGEDRWLLFRHFIGNDAAARLTPEARTILAAHPFYGNVRELKTLCRRLSIFHPQDVITGEIIQQHLEPSPPHPGLSRDAEIAAGAACQG